METIYTLNRMKNNFKPKTLGEHLDVFSYKLLQKDMNSNETNALR